MTTFKHESELQTKCNEYLQSLDNCWFLRVMGSAMQATGVPDLLICYRGTFYGVELKIGGKYGVSGAQNIQLRRIERAGGVRATITTVDQLRDLLESPLA